MAISFTCIAALNASVRPLRTPTMVLLEYLSLTVLGLTVMLLLYFVVDDLAAGVQVRGQHTATAQHCTHAQRGLPVPHL